MSELIIALQEAVEAWQAAFPLDVERLRQWVAENVEDKP
jgi:hypothetical protein